MPYVTPDQFLLKYSADRVAQILSTADAEVLASQASGSAVLADALADASGMIDGACRVGQRYPAADLAALADGAVPLSDGTTPPANGTALLRRLCSDLAFGLLCGFRGWSGAEAEAFAPRYKDALFLLEQLRLGERIFDIDSSADAGLPATPAAISFPHTGGLTDPKVWGCFPGRTVGDINSGP